MTTFFVIFLCVSVFVLVGWIVKSQRARDEQLANALCPKRESEQECENGDRTPDSQNEVRRMRNFYDDVQHHDYTDYDRIRAAKAERDAYDA